MRAKSTATGDNHLRNSMEMSFARGTILYVSNFITMPMQIGIQK